MQSRDGATREEALARIRAQKPLAEKARVADFVIDTSGSIEATRARADEVLVDARKRARRGRRRDVPRSRNRT